MGITDFLLSFIIAIIILILSYYYMNVVMENYMLYDKVIIQELPWYVVPRWANDAWQVTWKYINTQLIILYSKI